ncbi:histidine kinase dimerization/phospho-acceptor domain-containing protein [Neorhodopirellula lusitana]|uniref:histidine kinase dimerization/phospho-acceptor domain-containing protein n=1 Tax=Neorhodopirellula lusitana TaxID=445327 RepID=UPI0024B82B10|nr:histidine kinase dimerization/phospho-acceptor domain-containing protein [Neorhodopirellula lusitana]
MPTKDTNDQHLVERRRQRLESLGTLASGIVHDLNNLLTPILMSSRMLQRGGENIDREALLGVISSSASRGADLIAQLLTFARGGEGQHVRLHVDQVIPDVIAILRHTLPALIELKTEVQPDLPPMMGDETEIS